MKIVSGAYCPECGSETRQFSTREAHKWIKSKMKIKTGKQSKMHWRAAERLQETHKTEVKKENKKMKHGIVSAIFYIILFGFVAFCCVVFFPLGLFSLVLLMPIFKKGK